jgi:hypothetical protein
MQQKRRRGTVATENFMQPEILENRLEKYQNRDHESYEYVFYTNKCKDHLKGTNEYQFEFPGTWRTKTGGECILGIRSMHLKTIARPLRLTLNVKLNNDNYNHSISLYYTSLDTPYILLQALNEIWRDQFGNKDQLKEFAWYQYSDTTFILGETGVVRYFNPIFQWSIITGQTILECFTLDMLSYVSGDITFNRPLLKLKSDRTQNLLLRADFITHADNQHLGFTGSEYYPLKQYEIKKNTPYFMISLFEENNIRPIELPEDGKDYVVIEAVISRKFEV